MYIRNQKCTTAAMAFIYTGTVIVSIMFVMVAGYKEQLIKTIKECKNGGEVTEAEIEEFVKPLIPKTVEEKCLMACVLKAYNIMIDRVYDPKIAKAVLDQVLKEVPDKREKLKAVISHCGEDLKKNDDECELAAEILQCHEKYEREVGLM